MEGVIAWLAGRITEEPKREEHEIRLETDEAAVQLVTIHKSKGLEYPIVFLPFCWSEYSGKEETALFHDTDRRVVLDIGSDDFSANRALAEREALAESLRLLYVALTRGKHRTYLVWGAFKDAGDSSLRYLLHPEAEPAKGQVTLSDDEMLAELAELARSSSGGIELMEMPEADREPYLAPESDISQLEARNFQGTIARDWRVASFTSLASRHQHAAELPNRDEESSIEAQPAGGSEPTGIFAFPKGAKAGIFLHEIFEMLDFTAARDALPPLAEDLLNRHGFAAEWKGAVCSMVQNVLQAPLGEDRFTLAQVGMKQRCTEMEFFFPLAAITSDRLREKVARFSLAGARDFPVDMARLFGDLSFAPVRGMLRGFIDLVFEQGGRYYILDWKSNHLGNSVADYDQPALRREMEQNLYPLQYLLYTVALDNYLRLRITDYDYDRHFGGIYYLFLRGVDGTGNGVYADRPPKEFIAELAHVLLPASTRTQEAPLPSPSGRGDAGKKPKCAGEEAQMSLDLF